MLIDDFNHIVDSWINGLERYHFTQLYIKPSPDGWSLGQLYRHLIDDTNFYMDQIRICISTNDHADEDASPAAKNMFSNNEFPDERIEGAPSNSSIPQPASKEQLSVSLEKIKNEMNRLATLMAASKYKGKTKHPGLNYLNAHEWLQFAEMHFRHHLTQKKRLDEFLKMNTQ